MHPKQDFLKYWRVIRYYVKAKYGLTTPDLEMLLFLYSERYFKRAKFYEYSTIMSWDKLRFDRLRTQEWIVVFRKPNRRAGEGAVYCLSHKAKGVIKSIYQKLLANDEISLDIKRNPMAKTIPKHEGNFAERTYANRAYRAMIKKMNAEYREMRGLEKL